MLYPINLKTEEKKVFKEKIINMKNELECKIKCLVFDRSNIREKIFIKLHI